MTDSKKRDRKTIVVAGRDADVWLTAQALHAATLDTPYTIEVVELPSRIRPAHAYATLPPLEGLHRILQIEERDLVRRSAGVFSLGQSFVNFAGPDQEFFVPYGEHGAAWFDVPFLHHWLRAREAGLKVGYADFSLNAAAARYGRFFVADATTQSYQKSDYGYHLNAAAYSKFLKERLVAQGVPVHTSHDIEAQRDSVSGNIQFLTLRDGRRITGDLFIDASGQDSVLLNDTLKIPFEGWQAWFPFSRRVILSGPRMADIPPYGQSRALTVGVMHQRPLQDGTTVIMAVDPCYTSDTFAAESALVLSGLSQEKSQIVAGNHLAGRHLKAWDGNVVALGEAFATLDLINDPALHVLHQGIVRLIAGLLAGPDLDRAAVKFNAEMIAVVEACRDFQMTHYVLAKVPEGAMWNHLARVAWPDSLQRRIDRFRSSGDLDMGDYETFTRDNWLALLVAHGLLPERIAPAAQRVPEPMAQETFQNTLKFIRDQVENMTSHETYLEVNVPH